MTRRYKRGTARSQAAMLPAHIEDDVRGDNAVRAIDVFVDTLDMQALGFSQAGGGLTAGQPAYDPAQMLKLYLYSYRHRPCTARDASSMPAA
jgi:transposase